MKLTHAKTNWVNGIRNLTLRLITSRSAGLSRVRAVNSTQIIDYFIRRLMPLEIIRTIMILILLLLTPLNINAAFKGGWTYNDALGRSIYMDIHQEFKDTVVYDLRTSSGVTIAVNAVAMKLSPTKLAFNTRLGIGGSSLVVLQSGKSGKKLKVKEIMSLDNFCTPGEQLYQCEIYTQFEVLKSEGVATKIH